MTSILVVDDVAILREPIAAILRQEGYRVTTAANGADALRVVAEQPPDLILLDAAMPVMDGLTFCKHLRGNKNTAKIPVIMLTASTDRSVVMQAAQTGVQGYLLKSQSSTEELLSRIRKVLQDAAPAKSHADHDRATTTPESGAVPASPRDTARGPAPAVLTAERTLARVREHMQLRSIKPVLQHVLALTGSTVSSFDDIAAAIRQDQALSVRVIKVANSSFYSTGKPVKTVREAEQRIGLSGIRNMTTAILAIDAFADASPAGLVPQRFWEHALATAILGERIGTLVGVPNAEDVFLAGLLHDIGRLVLSDALPEQYAAVMSLARECGGDLLDLEREHFELTHADVTRELLLRWRLPAHVTEAAALHHTPVARLRTAANARSAVLAVGLANTISHALLLGDSGDTAVYPLRAWGDALGLAHDVIGKLAAEAVRKTADATVFYATKLDGKTLPPLSVTIGEQARRPMRVWTPEPCGPVLQPVRLLLEQLRWIDRAEPELAIVHGESELQMQNDLRALTAATGKGAGEFDIVRVAESGGAAPDPAPSDPRQVLLPCPYMRLVEVLLEGSRGPAVERLTAHAGPPR